MEFLDLDGKNQKQIVFDIFNLNDLQRSIFIQLEDSRMTVKEIAEEVNRNRSTVQRSLQDMMDKDLVMREGKTDKTVYYVYTTLPMEDVKEVTRKTLDQWHQEVKNRLS